MEEGGGVVAEERVNVSISNDNDDNGGGVTALCSYLNPLRVDQEHILSMSDSSGIITLDTKGYPSGVSVIIIIHWRRLYYIIITLSCASAWLQ